MNKKLGIGRYSTINNVVEKDLKENNIARLKDRVDEDFVFNESDLFYAAYHSNLETFTFVLNNKVIEYKQKLDVLDLYNQVYYSKTDSLKKIEIFLNHYNLGTGIIAKFLTLAINKERMEVIKLIFGRYEFKNVLLEKRAKRHVEKVEQLLLKDKIEDF